MEQGKTRPRQQYTLDARAAGRLWRRVRKDGPIPAHRPDLGPCWPWTGSCTANGYGQFHVRLDSGPWSVTVAHRVAYELTIGPIPDGLVLDHLCRNRACARPDHLEPTTDAANILRGTGWSARHARKTHCPQGHAYDERNTHVDKNGMRHCRTCDADRHRARREERRIALPGLPTRAIL
jgi:hypothetical protein